MKKLGLTLVMAMMAVMLVAGGAWATPIITLIDGSTATATATDTDGDGLVSFNGTVGGWAANVTTGISYPLIGAQDFPEIDLNSINVSSATAGTLSISLTDYYADWENLSSSVTGFMGSVGGTSDGWVDMSFNVNGAVHSISWGEMNTTGTAFAASQSWSGVPGSTGTGNPFALTITALIHHTGAGQHTSFDADIAPVPEPGTMALLGIGLLGLAFVGKRKIKIEE